MKRVLLVTTVSGFVPQFEMGNVRILQDMGYEVHYAANYHTPSYGEDNHRLDGTGIVRHQVDFERSPCKPGNLRAYHQMKALMRSIHFDLVHCHTPMGGVLARMAAHATHTGPVIYTAHGFHFYSGAPMTNWLFYYPVEYLLSYWTDHQICINQEDYIRARKRFHSRRVDYIPGVGIGIAGIRSIKVDKEHKKKELGIAPGDKILLSVGELISRKNHEVVIRALAEIRPDLGLIYVICGKGRLEGYLKKLSKELGVQDRVRFLGYRKDVYEIYKTADLFVFPSLQEGLPIALLEAVASGLPVLCSDIRGNRDLVGNPSALVKGNSPSEYRGAILRMLYDIEKGELPSGYPLHLISRFDERNVRRRMESIYRDYSC